MTRDNKSSTPDADDETIFISKGQLKREAEANLALATKLVALPKKQLAQIPLEAVVREAIDLARRLDNDNARKRQMRYIAKQIDQGNRDTIEAAFEGFHQQSLLFRGKIIEIEQWCHQLIEGDDELMERLIASTPKLDRQHLRQLLRQINKDIKAGKAPAAQKKLFQYLQQATA